MALMPDALLRAIVAGTVSIFPISAALRAQSPRTQPALRPNVVFILADDLGYGEVGCYGQKDIQTPNIDKLAAEGMRFTQAYAGAPVCAPSRCCLVTGLHTGHAFIRGNAKVNLRPQDVTVEELLKSAGYQTAITGKWGLGDAGSSGVPNAKGFDYFYGYLDQTHAHNSYPTFLLRNDQKIALRNVVPNAGQYGQGIATVKLDFAPDLIDAESTAWLDQQSADKPFFLYVANIAPHANDEARLCEVPDLVPYADKTWPESEKHYAALITRLDGYVGHVMAKLHEKHLDDNTLVIFTADNGPHEEGTNKAAFFHSSGPFRGIKRDLYEGGVRVPFITRWPGHVPVGTSSDYPLAFWDFLPTMTALAGLPTPANLDGRSFLPVLLGQPAPSPDPFFYWEFHERGFEQSVLTGQWKAVRHGLDRPLELYDLKTDPAEAHNIAADHSDIVGRITAYLATARTDSREFPIRPARGRSATVPATGRAP